MRRLLGCLAADWIDADMVAETQASRRAHRGLVTLCETEIVVSLAG